MMEAKGTVMKVETIKDNYGYTMGNKVWEVIEPLLQAQAEISFKAGEENGKASLLTEKQLTEHDDMVFKAGIKEVVEWFNSNNVWQRKEGLLVKYFAVDLLELKIQLEKWGIDEVSQKI